MIQGAAEEILCRENDLWCNWCHKLILISVIFIWAACGLHSFWNAILYSVLGLNLSGNEETVTAIFNMQSAGDNIWNGSIYGIEASAATTIVLAFTTTLVFVMGRKRVKRNDKF